MIFQLAALLSGFLFGIGLTISMMIDPNKIINFLDVTGNWDPSLLVVMLGAVLVAGIGFHYVKKLNHPTFAEKFCVADKTAIDTRLLMGSAIFGIGWGLAGYCPGPAISALGLGILDAAYCVLGMFASVFIYRLFAK